jgi:hypothetical protein
MVSEGVAVSNMVMGNRKKKPDAEPGVSAIRIRTPLAIQLQKLCEAKATTLVEEVNAAVREHLKREGLWPPPPPSDE